MLTKTEGKIFKIFIPTQEINGMRDRIKNRNDITEKGKILYTKNRNKKTNSYAKQISAHKKKKFKKNKLHSLRQIVK